MNKPDLTGIKIIHCAMRGDLHKLVTLTENITAGRETFNARRATALAVFVDEPCHAIHVQSIAATGQGNLCLAGGVALNRVAADKLRRLPAATGYFAPPAASDRGQALGPHRS